MISRSLGILSAIKGFIYCLTNLQGGGGLSKGVWRQQLLRDICNVLSKPKSTVDKVGD